MRNLIDIVDLSVEEINELIKVAKDIIQNKEKYSHKCDGKKLATLFFEPSTRTRLSFEAAMMELGGNVIGFSEASSSSTAKGESVADTIRTVGCYSDIIAMRHPKEGAPLVASEKSVVPIINAGDGGHHHPTQTLTDLLTIHCEKGRLENLTIGLCGDLKFGRTVHSLITAMARYQNIKFVLISPKELEIPEYVKKEILESIYNLINRKFPFQRFYNFNIYIKIKPTVFIKDPKTSIITHKCIFLCLVSLSCIRYNIYIKITLIPFLYFIIWKIFFPRCYTLLSQRRQWGISKPTIMNYFRYHTLCYLF